MRPVRSARVFASVLLSTLAATGLALFSSDASAQTANPGFAANRFDPSEKGSDWFANESLDLRGKFRPAIGVVGDYSNDVIVFENPDGSRQGALIAHQVFVHAGLSITLIDRIRIGASLPLALYQTGTATQLGATSFAPPDKAGIGDLRVGADFRLLGEYGDPMSIAVGLQAHLPTGSASQYLGDEKLRLVPRLLIAGDIKGFAYAVRAGYVLRGRFEDFADTRFGDELNGGAAIGVRFLEKKLIVGPEIFGSTLVADPFKARTTPSEVLLGMHYQYDDWKIGAGIGAGIEQAISSPNVRVLFGVEWAPAIPEPDRDHDGIFDKDDACPDVPGVHTDDPKTNGCPPRSDRDKDGVFDDEDACPDVPGVRTNDPKTNGCPVAAPSDRDGDGIPDSEDACPDVPGVKTDDPKTNGCPPDRDKDGILDKDDACPDVPGVKTDDPKTNGCPPDPDRDKDGIPNEIDACPDEAGPKSDDPKTSGCPRVFIKGDVIQILEQPKFDFNKSTIKKESDSLLTQISAVLVDHPAIKLVRVEGHTDNVGSAPYNKKLSLQRAQAVVNWLTAHGIAKDRLKADGIGKDRPLMGNDTDAGRAANRRVEFHIEQQEATTKELVKGPGGTTQEAPPTTPKDAPAPAPAPQPKP